jgi:hypothetical protein
VTIVRQTPSAAAPVFCHTRLNYLPSVDDASPAEVTIYDGRRAPLPGWHACGFELMAHRSRMTAWEDDARIAAVHYEEMTALARSLTGCDHALIGRHIRRNPEQAAQHADLGPITFVHSDFAESYGELMRNHYGGPRPEARQALERAGIAPEVVRAARRLLILQFWRNTGPPKMDLPVAFCDARSVAIDEVRALPVQNYAGGGFDFEALGVIRPGDPSQHRWYTFPAMCLDEVVAFRTFDSDLVAAGQAFWTPHSAFRDPEVPLGAPSRRSIELRVTCLFL